MGDNSLSNFARVDVIFSSRPRPVAFSERPVVLSSDRSAAAPFFGRQRYTNLLDKMHHR